MTALQVDDLIDDLNTSYTNSSLSWITWGEIEGRVFSRQDLKARMIGNLKCTPGPTTPPRDPVETSRHVGRRKRRRRCR